MNNRLDMLTARQRLVELLWDMVDDTPVMAALVEMWVRQIAVPRGDVGSRISQRLLRHAAELTRWVCQNIGALADNTEDCCDMLILPMLGRSNIISICDMLKDTLLTENPRVRVGMAYLGRSWFSRNQSRKDGRAITYHLSLNTGTKSRYLKEADKILGQVLGRIANDAYLSHWFEQRRAFHRRQAAGMLQKIDSIRGWLARIGCKILITPNEQDPSSSLFATAAKMNGLPCHQILHGTPARLYWPFVSDQTWVWGKTSQAAFLEYGAPIERVPIIGNLEITHWLKNLPYIAQKTMGKDLQSGKNFLFLSQLLGMELYNAPGFKDVFDWLAEILSSSDMSDWRVTVRMHPSDGEENRKFVIKKLGFLGNRLFLSQGQSSLLEDAKAADFACTCSSTAILTPLVIGIPSALTWTEDMNKLFGKPFFDETNVAKNAQELKALIFRGRGISSIDDIPSTMLSNIRMADKAAAQHILTVAAFR